MSWMEGDATGRFLRCRMPGENYTAFIPDPLPPFPPVGPDAYHLRLSNTTMAMGRLDGVAHMLPDKRHFLYAYVRREAVYSSQIEGTQSTLDDLYQYETVEEPEVAPGGDVGEVCGYVAAMDHGLARLAEGFPLSLRLIREMHAKLVERARGSHQTPGEFRRTQNWIGGTRPGNAIYVPPPPEEMTACLDSFEKFLHSDPPLPLAVKVALAHVQFESIHPFLDGNGRVGRLMIPFLLMHNRAIHEPLLYVSLFFKKHRAVYYERLQRVRTHGAWTEWVDFFLEALEESAIGAVSTAHAIRELTERDARQLGALKRAAAGARRLHGHLMRRPVTTLGRSAAELQVSVPAVTRAMENLMSLGIAEEISGRKWGRMFAYENYLKILRKE